jgi:[lysine-biosynthesis-protein LysW]---L-2-aminoadipate ligase
VMERSVAIAASVVRTEEKRLFEAFERRASPATHLDPRPLWGRVGAPLPRFSAVLDREVSQTRGLYLAHLFEASEVPVVNPAQASELCGDKVRASLVLGRHGLPLPRTAVALGTDAARRAAEELGFPLVVKPVVGSWGRMVSLLRDRDALEAVLDHRDAMPSPQHRILYLQELVDKPGRDIRVIVVGGRPIGAIYRVSADWRTGAARGAETQICPLGPELAALATRAAAALGAAIAGVDIVEDRAGRLLVLEVNHVVEFTGFMAAHGDRVDVAGAIADHVLGGRA